MILGLGFVIPLFYMLWSLKYGQPAGKNPWGAKGLEWEIDSPPPPHNFAKTPIVTQEAYAYAAVHQ
jgi:cytochrome c oxidase subunit 1